MSFGLWHVLPTLGLLGAVAIAVLKSPFVGYLTFAAAGLLFVAEDYWQPDLRRPLYLTSLPMTLLIALVAWPARLVTAWVETARSLAERYAVVGVVGSVQRFRRLSDARAAAKRQANAKGLSVLVFDHLSARISEGKLEARTIPVAPERYMWGDSAPDDGGAGEPREDRRPS